MSENIDFNSPEAMAAMQMQEKYKEERNKRVRADGLGQFVELASSEKYEHFDKDPWITEETLNTKPTITDGSSCEFLILGGGFGGLLFAARLIQAGFNAEDIRIVDSAGGFGGTWYWNRYPGLMCDVESSVYMPLLEEMNYMPKHRFSYGPELRAYSESVAEKYGLKDRATFAVTVHRMEWDDSAKQWVVKMSRSGQDMTVRARFVMTTSGLLSYPHLPNLAGIESFKGHSFHTSRWDYRYTGGSDKDPSMVNLKDKKVAFVGTGATAVQAVPHLAKWSKHLTVFQRTPSGVDERGQRPTDPEWWAKEVNTGPGWQRKRQENFNAFISNSRPLPSVNLIDDQWSKIESYCALIGGPNDVTPESIPSFIASLYATDMPRQHRLHRRIDEIVKDPETAQKLKPWYPSWCKRPCFHDEYLQSFNLPNVRLVDTDGKGIDDVTEKGIVHGGKEYEFDVIIYGTGYRSPSSGSAAKRANMTIIGRDGLNIDDKWASGFDTLHGVVSRDFPNLFYPGPFQAGSSANQTFNLDMLSSHVAHIVAHAKKKAGDKDAFSIEPTAEAEDAWGTQVMMRATPFASIMGCTPSYLNAEGDLEKIAAAGMEAQMKAARMSNWGQGIGDFLKIIKDWEKGGQIEGLEVHC